MDTDSASPAMHSLSSLQVKVMFNIGNASTVRTGVLNWGRSGLRNAPLAVPACPRVGLDRNPRLYLREFQRRAWSAGIRDRFALRRKAGALPFVTTFRPASVKQTLSPRWSIQPRSTATAIASFVRSFSLVGNPHPRHSPSVARYIAHIRNRAALSVWSAMSKLRALRSKVARLSAVTGASVCRIGPGGRRPDPLASGQCG